MILRIKHICKDVIRQKRLSPKCTFASVDSWCVLPLQTDAQYDTLRDPGLRDDLNMTGNHSLTTSDTVTRDSLVAVNTTLTFRVRKQFFWIIIQMYLLFFQHSSVFCAYGQKFKIQKHFRYHENNCSKTTAIRCTATPGGRDTPL